jgi:metal-dependent amidase/aminoacylase/carboxypeptidase family protein
MQPNTLERVIEFRKEVHTYPEIGFEEYETRERIRKILLEFGVPAEQMFDSEPTAMYVDLKGKA